MMIPFKEHSNKNNWRTKLSNWLGDEYFRLSKEEDELSDNKIALKLTSSNELSNSWKDYIYANDIVSGFDIISQSKNFNKRNIAKSVDYILDNRIYDNNAIYNDLTPILKNVISQEIIEEIDFSSVDDLSFDDIFNNLIDLYAFEYFDYEALFVLYHEVNKIFINRDQKEFHLKSKALNGLLDSLKQIRKENEQNKISLELPIIFKLKEYWDLINNIKKLLPEVCGGKKSSVNVLKYWKDEPRIQNRHFMLAYQGQREQGFLQRPL